MFIEPQLFPPPPCKIMSSEMAVSVLSNTVTTSFQLNEINCFSITLTRFQVLDSHMWLVAAILASQPLVSMIPWFVWHSKPSRACLQLSFTVPLFMTLKLVMHLPDRASNTVSSIEQIVNIWMGGWWRGRSGWHSFMLPLDKHWVSTMCSALS